MRRECTKPSSQIRCYPLIAQTDGTFRLLPFRHLRTCNGDIVPTDSQKVSALQSALATKMLRGFSNFEQMFRAKMAVATPKEVMVVKKVKDGNTEEEIASYKATFDQFDVDGGGAIDSKELGRLIRVLG